MSIHKFQPGKKYQTRSSCDHSMIISIKVISRTPKTITASVDGKEPRRFRPGILDDSEYVMPWGNYSMCPFIQASEDLA